VSKCIKGDKYLFTIANNMLGLYPTIAETRYRIMTSKYWRSVLKFAGGEGNLSSETTFHMMKQ